MNDDVPVGCIVQDRYVIIADVPVTVRKRMTLVYDEPGNVIWAGLSLEAALVWLRELDVATADLVSPTGNWSLNFERALSEEDKSLWLGQPPHS